MILALVSVFFVGAIGAPLKSTLGIGSHSHRSFICDKFSGREKNFHITDFLNHQNFFISWNISIRFNQRNHTGAGFFNSGINFFT